MNKKILMISLFTILGIISILVGTIAYYGITVNGTISGTTGMAVFNLTGFTNESTKEIVLKDGKLVPGDKGSFTLSLDATGSAVDMYVTLYIERGTLPTNLKFYTTSDYKSEFHKYYEFMDTSNQSKSVTIYWYWNPYISDEEDSNFINNIDVSATVKLNAVQVSGSAVMKNGNGAKTEFWSDTYREYIQTITFDNDLSNLPSSCTGDSDLCWDISYSDTQLKKVYAYLIDSGAGDSLYNLYIVSEVPVFAPSSCEKMFYNFTKLTSIEFNNNFNTSNVTNMNGMFNGCSVLTSLDLSSFNTSNVTNMNYIFYSCSALSNIDISSFNTSNVTDMGSMFCGCSVLINLDLSSFNTYNVTNMSYMFSRCSVLTNIDLSSFNTYNVTNMGYMFYDCSSLASLDISSFNTSKVVNMSFMFCRCPLLTSLDLSSFNTSKVTDMNNMFGGCSSLTSLDISSFNTYNVTNMGYMFYDCSSLTTTINIMSTGVTDYSSMFDGAATNTGAQITVNYIADASTLVDSMIATKSSTSNVVKGSVIS